MPKQAVFTMKIEPELRDAFMSEAAAGHRPESQLVRELIRAFIQRQQDAREHDAFLRRKVALARISVQPEQDRLDVWDYTAADSPPAAALDSVDSKDLTPVLAALREQQAVPAAMRAAGG